MSRCLFFGTALALAVLVAGFPAPTLAAPTRNLLAEPSFESTRPGHSWMAVGWDTSTSGLPTVFFGRDTVLSHAGHYAVSVANVSTLIPYWHNWSQTLIVGPEMWNKDVVLTAWTRSNGVQGRGYILVHAMRDTIGKMARTWSVPRDSARIMLGINIMEDPYVYLGVKRAYFSESETDWVQRQVRVYVPPSTNLIIVRCGIFGTGQVYFDDVSLTAEAALPPPELPVGVNLLKDPGFEGDGNSWDYSLPPYEEVGCDRETTIVHSGKASVRLGGGSTGMVDVRAGVVQLIPNRSLAGKHVRFTAWAKCDSLSAHAYLKLFATTHNRDVDTATPRLLTGSTPWTQLEMEMDTPDDTYHVWVWMQYNAPSPGRVYFDDASLEILGPARTKSPSPQGMPRGSKAKTPR